MSRRLVGRYADEFGTSCSSDGETVVGTENLNVGHHVVQFYGHDEELADRVTDYLLGALKGDGVAIVIATAAHRREFEARLAQAGVDLADACAHGAYLAMDAAETVRELMASDQLDNTTFDRVIGGLIRRAGAGGRTVTVYGEMVALLWDDGLVSAAAQLEAMWNELSRRHPFSLFCGYRSDSVTRGGYLDAFAEVCRLHQEVVGFSPAGPRKPRKPREPRVVRTFAFSRDAPAVARHFAVGALRDWGAGDLADDAALVVTELAANAIVHAHSGFTIVLSARGDLVRISVRDASPLPGAEPGAALVPARLHGLGVVDALASSWGVESLGSAGKTVWVELRG
jgi:MEDS: MEthanogen/methylotroph, DcmR Sensory domain